MECSFAVPFGGFEEILADGVAGLVEHTEVDLADGVAEFG